MDRRPIEILLIEDNPAEVRLTMEGLKEFSLPHRLSSVMDGDSALDFLHRRGPYRDAPAPDLILLDLNLPGTDGRAVLNHIKQDAKLKITPVIIISSSEAESDIRKSYESHANCFISKPIDFVGLGQVVRAIENFWFTVVRLP